MSINDLMPSLATHKHYIWPRRIKSRAMEVVDMGVSGSTRFVLLPKVKWIPQEERWEEPVMVRVAVSEILNYQPWRFHQGDSGARQKKATPFEVTKVMVRRIRTEVPQNTDNQRDFKDGIMIVALDIRDLDVYLSPLILPNTFRPY